MSPSFGCKGLGETVEDQELVHCRCSVDVTSFSSLSCYTFILVLMNGLETCMGFNLAE